MIIEAHSAGFAFGIEDSHFIKSLQRKAEDVYIVCGATYTRKIAENISKEINCNTKSTVKIYSTEEVKNIIKDYYLSNKSDSSAAVLGVGGGASMDYAKLLASYHKGPFAVLPTALSSDAIGAPFVAADLSSLAKHSFLCRIPEVIFDYEIMVHAPKALLKSGVFDVLSNASAVLDARNSSSEKFAMKHALDLSLTAAKNVARLQLDIYSRAGHQEVLFEILRSGQAMAIAGDSSPCSGAEHLICHALNKCSPRGIQHGHLVGMATLICHEARTLLGMEGVDKSVLEYLRREVDVLNPAHFGYSAEEIYRSCVTAAEVRPNRRTFMDINPNITVWKSAFKLAFKGA